MTENPHTGSDALAFLEEIVPDTPETRRVEKQERFRIALTQAMRDLRNQVGLTQKELAQRLGIGQSWVSKLESANNDHTFESVLAYLDAMDASFQAMILLSGEKVARVSSEVNPHEELIANSDEQLVDISPTDYTGSAKFEFVPQEQQENLAKAQALVANQGLWGVGEVLAA